MTYSKNDWVFWIRSLSEIMARLSAVDLWYRRGVRSLDRATAKASWGDRAREVGATFLAD